MNNIKTIKCLSLKEYFEFLSYENISVPYYHRHYKYEKRDVQNLYVSLGEGFLGEIHLIEKKSSYTPSIHYYNLINGHQRTITLILLLKVLLHKKVKYIGDFDILQKLNDLNYTIADEEEFADFKKVDNYLNGEVVEFNNKHYQEAIDTLIEMPEVNADMINNTTFAVVIFDSNSDENYLYNREFFFN